MRRPARVRLLLPLGAAAIVIAAILALRHFREDVAADPQPETAARVMPLAGLARADDAIRRESLDVPAPSSSLQADVSPAPTTRVIDTRTLRGQLVSRVADDELGGLDVTLAAHRDGEPLRAKTRTAQDGAFAFELDAERWPDGTIAAADVRDERRVSRFSGPVAIADGMTLVVRSRRVLRGTLEFRPPGLAAPAGIVVHARAPRPGSARRFAGSCTVEPDGTYLLETFTDVHEVELDFAVWCHGYRFEATTVHTGPGTMDLVVELARLAVEVVRADGRVVPDVPIQFNVTGGDSLVGELRADGAGLAAAVLPPGIVWVHAQPDGDWPSSAKVELRTGEESRVRLVVSAEEDGEAVLDGRMALFDGTPLAAAFVTGDPVGADAHDRAAMPIASARTDADGRFRLRFAGPGSVAVRAYHRDHGETDLHVVEVPQSGFVLTMPAHASALVELVPREARGTYSSGAVQLVTVHRASGAIRDDHMVGASYSLEELREGAHDLFAFAPGWFAHGRTSFDARAGEPTLVLLELVPALAVEGVVSERSGTAVAGATVVARCPSWSDAIRERFGTAQTDATGRFRVPVATDQALELVVTSPDGRTWRGTARAGAAWNVAFPARDG